MKIPVITAKKLWHLGSLDIKQKGNRGASYEGNLLSASACPDAWMKICRLSGSQAHETKKHLYLLDMLEVTHPKTSEGRSLREKIIEDGLDNGNILQRTLFKASYYDDELEDMLFTLHHTRDEALYEYDEDVEIEEVTEYFCSPSLLAQHKQGNSGFFGIDFAIIEWAKKQDLDGVYWDERLAPDILSAPRAGIFDRAIKHFKPVDHLPDDEEGLTFIARTQWVSIGKNKDNEQSHNSGLFLS